MRRVAFWPAALALAIVMSVAVLTVSAAPAKAWVSGTLWDPGNIISNQQFFDGDAMSTSQIQSFLNAKVPTCHPEWSAGPSDPIVCLKDYRQTTISRSADAYCPNAYVGGSNETAATIIYKVAQACDISPKVLLVTLQKEQGLVTHTWPSAYRYDIAMGYGCPDTGSGCIDEYYGFQNQVWRAARQFQRYRLLPTSYNYRAGVNNLIGYHPNASCGTQTVYIQNSATAALYNYTPYVPNSAALAAIPGTGNSCSSYGNRNFFMYYWEWFGSPSATSGTSAIYDHYVSLGGAAGALGAQLATRTCAVGASWCWQDYAGGMIGWTQAGGAWAVLSGDVYDAYFAAGGPGGSWGLPTSLDDPVESPTGDGHRQNFQNVQVLASASGVFGVPRLLLAEYARLAWVRGSLGWPVSDATCSGAICAQTFQGGVLAQVNGQHVEVPAGTLPSYLASGGVTGPWGAPTSSSTAFASVNGPGERQNFQQGQVLASVAGAFFVPSRILATYATVGWIRGPLGWPTAGAVCEVSGACTQEFQHGVIAVPAGSGDSVAVAGDIYDAYLAAGGDTGLWGAPTSSVASFTSVNGPGVRQNFVNGQALSSVAGAFLVPNRLMPTYASAGWIRGALGWPTGAAVCDGSGACTQEFQYGTIATPAGTGPGWVVDAGPIAVAFEASGGSTGPWGAATSTLASFTSVNGAGERRNFVNGQALSSAAGAFLVPNRLMAGYAAAGWIRGSLGWPTAAAVCDGSGACAQQFQGGRLVQVDGQYFQVVGGILTSYLAAGGVAGSWGAPISSVASFVSVNGPGVRQNFVNGQALSSAAGAYLVPNRLMPTYASAGWIRGALGWPTAAAVCEGSGACTQQFQHGAVAVPAGDGAGTVILG